MAGFIPSLLESAAQGAQVSRLDKLGYIPLVGTVSGTCRIIYGVAKAVFSAIAAVFSIIVIGSTRNFGYHFEDGLLHAVRGLIELIPIIGGIVTHNYDKYMQAHRMAAAHMLRTHF